VTLSQDYLKIFCELGLSFLNALTTKIVYLALHVICTPEQVLEIFGGPMSFG